MTPTVTAPIHPPPRLWCTALRLATVRFIPPLHLKTSVLQGVDALRIDWEHVCMCFVYITAVTRLFALCPLWSLPSGHQGGALRTVDMASGPSTFVVWTEPLAFVPSPPLLWARRLLSTNLCAGCHCVSTCSGAHRTQLDRRHHCCLCCHYCTVVSPKFAQLHRLC